MDYLHWNDRIGAHFFNAEMSGRRVYLQVTNALIQQIGQSENVDVSDFVRAVKLGPPWCTDAALCLRAEQALVGWRRRKRPFPPYIGFLSLFVLAAEVGEQGEFAAQAYYPRLRKLLDEDPGGKTFEHFSEMRRLWRDLEVWSQIDTNSSLGVFEFPATGRLVHVGVPISQLILSADERRNLPLIFVEAALDPTASPTDTYLAGALVEYGSQWLRSRTIRALESPSNHQEEYQALIRAVLDELAVWDGKVTQITEHGTTQRKPSLVDSLPRPQWHSQARVHTDRRLG